MLFLVRYTEEQKAEALKLADEISVKKASEQLSISYQSLLAWRKKRVEPAVLIEDSPLPSPQPVVSEKQNLSLEMQVQLLKQENTQLKVQLARQTKAIHALSQIGD